MNITGKLLTIIVSTLVLSVFAAACGSDTPAVEEPAEETKYAPMEESVPEESTQPDPTPEPPTPEPTEAPPTPEPTEAPPEDTANGTGRIGNEPLAPELTGVFSWINSEPLTLEELRGDVVLIDFWTYTCINCIRTLPYLRDWHEKYADLGLTIIGVHTPEFDFEKKKENVIDAVAEYGLKYPVVQDNDFGTWRAFENRYWPAKYLIDKDGYIRYTHFGEGAYQETEEKIRELLMETSSGVEEISLDVKPAPEVHTAAYSASGSATSLTRELYAGYERNYGSLQFGPAPPYVLPDVHPEYYTQPDGVAEYMDPGEHNNHFLYLQGMWRNGKESLRHARVTTNYEDYMALRFYGNSANVVLSPEGDEPYEIRVTLDDKPVAEEYKGADIMYDDEGNSYVRVDEPRMYRLVSTPTYSGHDMKLSSNSDAFSVFAFTFGAYTDGS